MRRARGEGDQAGAVGDLDLVLPIRGAAHDERGTHLVLVCVGPHRHESAPGDEHRRTEAARRPVVQVVLVVPPRVADQERATRFAALAVVDPQAGAVRCPVEEQRYALCDLLHGPQPALLDEPEPQVVVHLGERTESISRGVPLQVERCGVGQIGPLRLAHTVGRHGHHARGTGFVVAGERGERRDPGAVRRPRGPAPRLLRRRHEREARRGGERRGRQATLLPPRHHVELPIDANVDQVHPNAR